MFGFKSRGGGGTGGAELAHRLIGVGDAGNELSGTTALQYNTDTEGAVEVSVAGRPLGTFAALKGIITNLLQTSEVAVAAAVRNGVRFASLVARQAGPAAAPTAQSWALRFADATAVRGTFNVADDSNAAGSVPLMVDVTDLDVYTGSDVELAQAATVGFLHIPTIAADPTGVPTHPAVGGNQQAPMCFNPHNGKLWIYDFVTAVWVSK